MTARRTDGQAEPSFGVIQEIPGQPPYRARIAGTGIEVWEVANEYRLAGNDWGRCAAGSICLPV